MLLKQINLGKATIAGLGTIVMMLGTGCEALDFADPNSPVIEVASVQTLVTGAEAGMRISLAIYLRDVSVIGREAYYFEPADPRYTGELLRGPIDPGGFLLTQPWVARYNVIKNTVLLQEKGAALDAAGMAGVDGFAKTIRAYQLLMNLNLLNDNGLQLDFDGESSSFETKAQVMTEITSLLNGAVTDLAAAGSSFPFSLSSGFDGFDTPTDFTKFNRALAARVAIYNGAWQDALTALGLSFIDGAGDFDLGVYHVFSTAANDQTNGIFESTAAATIKYMGHPTFETDAESGDTRFAAKVYKRTASVTFDDLTTDWGISLVLSSTEPLPIIRNEELILLRAEANIGLLDYTAAQTDLDIIRTAAGLASVTIDANNALDQLLHEKRYSLFGEGHRWIDMRRYGKLGDLPLDRTGDVIITDFPIPEDEISE
ncbi:MAG: RagB/SusD family nutrient uptake outer membrane protein [Candidatus Marinimicrobia bacterium]|nr:RagB/SusD family nutrient uptake outer membrane protein [Candidatus Neomarinimicrobiota bacterium]